MAYPRIAELIANPKIKIVKPKDTGLEITIPGQAMSLKDIVKRSIKGFPVPMQREELILHPDLNQVLKGTNLKIVSDAKFSKMSRVDRQMYLNNLAGLKSQLNTKVEQARAQKAQLDAQINQGTPANPPTPSAPETTAETPKTDA